MSLLPSAGRVVKDENESFRDSMFNSTQYRIEGDLTLETL